LVYYAIDMVVYRENERKNENQGIFCAQLLFR
jgi:hypothetical protein